MARPTRHLIAALLVTAERIEAGSKYQWGHMGCCNCGHLAQTLTRQPRAEIHAAALMRAGDWGEQSVEYCATSGYPLDHIISTMLEAGMSLEDLNNLERLSDQRVLARRPLEGRWLKRNSREDAIVYLREWAAMLGEELEAMEGGASLESQSVEAICARLRAADPELSAAAPAVAEEATAQQVA
jgi:hypothetical protein